MVVTMPKFTLFWATSLSTTSRCYSHRLSTRRIGTSVKKFQEPLRAVVSNPEWIQKAIDETTTIAKNSASSWNVDVDIQTRFVLIDTLHPGNVGSSARSIKTMGFFPEGLVVINPKDEKVMRKKKCIEASSGAKDVLKHATLVVTNNNCDEDSDNTDNRISNNAQDQSSSNDSGQQPTSISSNGNNNASNLRQAIEQSFGTSNIPTLICGTGMPVDMANERTFVQTYLEPRKFLTNLLEAKYRNSNDDDDRKQQQLNIAFCFGNERYGMSEEDLRACDVLLGIPTHPSFGSLNLAKAVQIIAYDWRQALVEAAEKGHDC